METYYFKTNEFRVSDTGIHVLGYRSTKTYLFKEIREASVKKGKAVNNWMLLFIIGLILLGFAGYYSYTILEILLQDKKNHIRALEFQEIILPVIPFLFGSYYVFVSTRKGLILHIQTSANKTITLSLKELEKKDQLETFKKFLKSKKIIL